MPTSARNRTCMIAPRKRIILRGWWQVKLDRPAGTVGHITQVVADSGSSQKKNSLAPRQATIRGAMENSWSRTTVLMVPIDQDPNDLNTIFGMLYADPERCAGVDANIFPSASGRSCHESVLFRKYVTHKRLTPHSDLPFRCALYLSPRSVCTLRTGAQRFLAFALNLLTRLTNLAKGDSYHEHRYG